MTVLLTHLSTWYARRRAKLSSRAMRDRRPDGGIGAEAPIRTASEDRLRRTDFASRIGSVLSELSLQEGRVFAIRGGWGFGKSSLKNLITERFDAKSDGADWLDFNPLSRGAQFSPVVGIENSPSRSCFGLFRTDEASLQFLFQSVRIAPDCRRARQRARCCSSSGSKYETFLAMLWWTRISLSTAPTHEV